MLLSGCWLVQKLHWLPWVFQCERSIALYLCQPEYRFWFFKTTLVFRVLSNLQKNCLVFNMTLTSERRLRGDVVFMERDLIFQKIIKVCRLFSGSVLCKIWIPEGGRHGPVPPPSTHPLAHSRVSEFYNSLLTVLNRLTDSEQAQQIVKGWLKQLFNLKSNSRDSVYQPIVLPTDTLPPYFHKLGCIWWPRALWLPVIA